MSSSIKNLPERSMINTNSQGLSLISTFGTKLTIKTSDDRKAPEIGQRSVKI